MGAFALLVLGLLIGWLVCRGIAIGWVLFYGTYSLISRGTSSEASSFRKLSTIGLNSSACD